MTEAPVRTHLREGERDRRHERRLLRQTVMALLVVALFVITREVFIV